MVMASFSIVMATYNGERFLNEQLQSILRQTHLPSQLVVCDDGSTDETVVMLQRFKKQAPFPVLILRNGRNRGHAEAFLRAVAHARAPWIAFCDQDDVWFNHKLATLSDIIGQYPQVDLISHSGIQADEHLRPFKHRVPNHRTFKIRGPFRSPPLQSLPGFSLCVRRTLLTQLPLDARPRDERRPGKLQPHDRLTYHLANTFGHTAYLPVPLAFFRRHPGTDTGAPDSGRYSRGFLTNVKRFFFANRGYFVSLAEEAEQHEIFYRFAAEYAERHEYPDTVVCAACKACGYYHGLKNKFLKRARIYSGITLRDRGKAIGDAFRSDVYAAGNAGVRLGRLAAIRDILALITGR